MFRDGKDISEIATARSLTVGTIAGHLGEMVQLGEINLEDVIPQESSQSSTTRRKNSQPKAGNPIIRNSSASGYPRPIPAHYLSLYARARR